ncbi:MAG: hypothetical protein ACM3OO_03720 [Planctomycetaceae bacterium]
MSDGIRTALDRLLRPDPGTLLALEPLFWVVLAGVICGLAIQLVIVGGMILTMAGCAAPHRFRKCRHQLKRRAAVWFGGHGGAHARPVLG